jgi:FtsP/CotA-like multicopper oxidase with cupredoxin domain
MKTISRREFFKYSIGAAGGLAVVVVGSKLSWLSSNQAYAQAVTQTLHFRVTDAIKEMHTHEPSGLEIGTGIVPNEVINDARCYFWIYKSVDPGNNPALDFPPESPGPIIVAADGDEITITVTNDLDEPHAFFIPGMVDSGPITPGSAWTGTFTVHTPGAHLYYDNLNEPVNRVMGLHGAFIVLPTLATPGHSFTPYGPLPANHGVQRLYDDFGGSTAHFPGLAWEEGYGDPGDPGYCPPFRRYVWITHQASPKLFAEVGSLAPGELYDPQEFMDAFLRDPFQPHAFHTDNPDGNRIPQYFTINGQSGYFSHLSPYITPMGRVGEPCVVHILNPGLWLHSMHLHANHFYVTAHNGVNPNPIFVDTYNVHPMDRIDYTVPFERPPDVPNVRGIGYADTPLTSLNGTPVWPPMEELDVHLPDIGEDEAENIFGEDIDLEQRLSPLCYPMHDHSEPTQTCQGGNYNTGLISGIYFVGDRNTPSPAVIPPGYPANFPMDFPEMADWTLIYRDANGNPVRGINVTSPAAPPTTID